MFRALCAAAVVSAALPALAGATDERAFTLIGREPFLISNPGGLNLPSGGTDVASDLSRDVVGVAWLRDDRIAVLSRSGRLELLGTDGRLRPLARIRGAVAVDEEADGSLLVAGLRRVWRVTTSGAAIPITPRPRGARYVGDVIAAPDGGFVYFLHDFEHGVVMRVSPDGTRRTIAGSRRLVPGSMKEGPAREVSIGAEAVLEIAEDGTVVVSGDQRLWSIGADGMLRTIAGGGRRFRPVPVGTPVSSVAFESVEDLTDDPEGGLLLVDETGVRAIRGGAIAPLARGDFPGPWLPLWSGRPVADAWLGSPETLDAGGRGDIIAASSETLTLIARPGVDAPRLAVALDTDTLASVRQGSVTVAATREADVVVRAVTEGRTVGQATGRVGPGTTSLPFPVQLPPGVVTLTVTASHASGAVATHRLRVLGSAEVPISVTRRVFKATYDDFNTGARIGRCRRIAQRRVTCRVRVSSEGGIERVRPILTLRDDGWLWIERVKRPFRVEVA